MSENYKMSRGKKDLTVERKAKISKIYDLNIDYTAYHSSNENNVLSVPSNKKLQQNNPPKVINTLTSIIN